MREGRQTHPLSLDFVIHVVQRLKQDDRRERNHNMEVSRPWAEKVKLNFGMLRPCGVRVPKRR